MSALLAATFLADQVLALASSFVNIRLDLLCEKKTPERPDKMIQARRVCL